MDQPPDEPEITPPQNEIGFGAHAALVAGMFVGVVGLCLLIVIVSNTGVEWTWEYWGEHKVGDNGTGEATFDRSTIFRNFGLAALAVIGLALAVWRSWLAHQQTRTGLRQADTANKQAETAERGLIIDRYQKGALMLESDELTVRMAGVSGLRELALSDPKETYILVLDVLFNFVREKSKARQRLGSDLLDYAKASPKIEFEPFGADLSEALKAATHLRNAATGAGNLETENDWKPDLTRANLSGAVLSEANLSSAKLWKANLSGANLKSANLFGANLRLANLSGAHMLATKLDRETDLTHIWAFENAQPDIMPNEMNDAITYRKPHEDWKDFQSRIEQVRV